MTAEEIKERYSMRDIVEKYGYKVNRAGFINCPFHSGDRSASLHIRDKVFYCFGCGEHGDIFKFIQLHDGVSFSDAFLSLGGEYVKPSSLREKMARDAALRKAEKERRAKQKEKEAYDAEIAAEIKRLSFEISACRLVCDEEPELSRVWCYAYDRLLMTWIRLYGLTERRLLDGR